MWQGDEFRAQYDDNDDELDVDLDDHDYDHFDPASLHNEFLSVQWNHGYGGYHIGIEFQFHPGQ